MPLFVARVKHTVHVLHQFVSSGITLSTFRVLFFLMLITLGKLAQGQQYPIHVTNVLTPPYSIYLSDYGSPEGNNMQVILNLLELDRLEYKVKLRFTIEGQNITLRTKPNYNPAPIILQGGISEILSGMDIGHYLNPDNLDFTGITKARTLSSSPCSIASLWGSYPNTRS